MNLHSPVSFSVLAALLVASSAGLGTSSAQAKEKPSKPLTDYTVISVEKFAVGAFSTKEGFPPDFAKVRFIFRDAQSNKEVLRSDLQGNYAGTWNVTGGSSEKATRKSAEHVVEELIKEIHMNR